jgi:hypothetical protein
MYNVVACLRTENLSNLGNFLRTLFKIPLSQLSTKTKRCRLGIFKFEVVQSSVSNRPFVAGGKVGSFACFGCAAGFEGQANVPMRACLLCPRGMVHNVSICVRAGLPKPRPVPDTEHIKDTKTLDYTSTPLDANTLLGACAFVLR